MKNNPTPVSHARSTGKRAVHHICTCAALLALAALSALHSNACRAAGPALQPQANGPTGSSATCTLTHDSSLPGHFMLLRLCQLQQQNMVANAIALPLPAAVMPADAVSGNLIDTVAAPIRQNDAEQ